MSAVAFMTALACAAFLALAALAILKGTREALTSRFAALCVVLFAYDALELVAVLHKAPVWLALDRAFASMATPFFFDFTMRFLDRSVRAITTVVYVYFIALAIGCLSVFVTPVFSDSTWAVLMLAGMLPASGWGAIQLARYVRANGPSTHVASVFIFAAIVIAVVGNSVDLLVLLGAKAPRLGPWSLVLSGLFLWSAMQSQVLSDVTMSVAFNVILCAIFTVAGELALYRWFGDRIALLVVGSLVIALLAFIAWRFLLSVMREEHERLHVHAAIGQRVTHLLHDLGGPMNLIRNDAQLLQGAFELGEPFDTHRCDKIIDAVDQMVRMANKYIREAEIVPDLQPTDLNALVEKVLGATKKAVDRDFDATLPNCLADEDLVFVAIENVVRNASEAIGESEKRIAVSTYRDRDRVCVRVRDEGPGMDRQTQRRAFQQYFTTKREGSGLGLAWVKRVANAHGDDIDRILESAPGKGTTVTLSFRVASA